LRLTSKIELDGSIGKSSDNSARKLGFLLTGGLPFEGKLGEFTG
jgi:hypothetical protein